MINKRHVMTSPMGWNSWDCYGGAVTEEIVRQNAEFMAKHLKPYGWEYIVVDIQWSEPDSLGHAYRPFSELCVDEYGRLIPAPNRFPSAAGGKGFAPLAEYVHSLGLKFGIHIMRGIPRQAAWKNCPVLGTEYTAREVANPSSVCEWNPDMHGVDPKHPGAKAYYDSIFALYAEWGVDFIKCEGVTARDIANPSSICGWNPDMYGLFTDNKGAQEYYDSIFELYASWGVDYIKCDDIANTEIFPHNPYSARKEIEMMRKAMDKCGRDMVFSLSPGPAVPELSELYKDVAHMWRITDDFWDNWRLLYDMFSRAKTWCIHTGAGNWPDADMLPIGALRQCKNPDIRTKFTQDEHYTMMTLWSIFRSPLMIGSEMTKMDEFTMSVLTNTGILEMHKAARNAHEVWRRKSEDGEAILWTANHAEKSGRYAALFNAGESDAEIGFDLTELELTGAETVTDLWTGKSIPAEKTLRFNIPKHGAVALWISEK